MADRRIDRHTEEMRFYELLALSAATLLLALAYWGLAEFLSQDEVDNPEDKLYSWEITRAKMEGKCSFSLSAVSLIIV